VPAGGAGLMGQTIITIKPKATAAVKMPKPRVLVVATLATKVGLHLLSRWEDETKPLVRHGPKKAAAWSQASIERHLVERIERSRRAYDADIVELNRVKDLNIALKGITEKRKKSSGIRGVKAQEPPVEL